MERLPSYNDLLDQARASAVGSSFTYCQHLGGAEYVAKRVTARGAVIYGAATSIGPGNFSDCAAARHFAQNHGVTTVVGSHGLRGYPSSWMANGQTGSGAGSDGDNDGVACEGQTHLDSPSSYTS